MTEPRIEELHRTAAGFPEARLVVLFGSMARGQAAPWSDADLGVSGLEYWRGLELGAALGAVLEREPHLVDLDTASDWLRYRAALEGVLLWEGEPDAWAKFQAAAMLRYFDLAPIIELCAGGARRALAGREGAARGGGAQGG